MLFCKANCNMLSVLKRLVKLPNSATLYKAKAELRLEQQGWIDSEWGVSDNNRRARFYKLTEQGVQKLETEIDRWKRLSHIVNTIIAEPAL